MVIGDEGKELIEDGIGPAFIDPSKQGHVNGVKERFQRVRQSLGPVGLPAWIDGYR